MAEVIVTVILGIVGAAVITFAVMVLVSDEMDDEDTP